MLRFLKESAPAWELFVNFFGFLSIKFAACSRPLSKNDHHKASYPRTQQRDQGADWTLIMRSELSWKDQSTSCDQGCHKNESFYLSSTLLTIHSIMLLLYFETQLHFVLKRSFDFSYEIYVLTQSGPKTSEPPARYFLDIPRPQAPQVTVVEINGTSIYISWIRIPGISVWVRKLNL